MLYVILSARRSTVNYAGKFIDASFADRIFFSQVYRSRKIPACPLRRSTRLGSKLYSKYLFVLREVSRLDEPAQYDHPSRGLFLVLCQINFLLKKKLRSRDIHNFSTSNLKFFGLKANKALRLKFKLLSAKPARVGSA